jgi:glycosyltransferase involved in cell wall biosynthesis
MRWLPLVGVSSFILIALSSTHLGRMLQLPSPVPVIVAATTLVSWSFLPVTRGILQGIRSFRALGASLAAEGLVKLGAGILLVSAGFGLTGAVAGVSIGAFAALVITQFHLRELRRDDRENRSRSDEVLHGLSPFAQALACYTILTQADVILAKILFSPIDAGVYAAASTAGKIILYLTAPLVLVMVPQVARLNALGVETRGVLRWALSCAVLVGSASVVIFFLYPEQVIYFLFGRQFSAAAPLVGPLGLSMLWYELALIGSYFRLARKQGSLLPLLGLTVVFPLAMLLSRHSITQFTHAVVVLAFAAMFTVFVPLVLAGLSRRQPSGRRKPILGITPRAFSSLPTSSNGIHGLTCSVGIMAYNEERNISQLLEFLACEAAACEQIREIVVVASGCTDGTVSLVDKAAQKFPIIRLHEESARNGKGAAINVFLKAAQSPICVLVNADTLPVPGAIATLVESFGRPGVGMVGGRPVPRSAVAGQDGFWLFAGRVLWELHHSINLCEVSPKLGEFVAFRRDAIQDGTLEKTPTDEALIEVHVSRAGYSLAYVPGALVYLETPRSIGDFVKRRRSIYCGHLSIARQFGYIVPTMRTIRVARALLHRREFLWPARHLVLTLGTVCLEACARALGYLDFVRGRDHSIWEVAGTTKSSLDWAKAVGTSDEG